MPKPEETKIMTFRCPASVLEELGIIATRERRSLSQQIVLACEQHIEQNKEAANG